MNHGRQHLDSIKHVKPSARGCEGFVDPGTDTTPQDGPITRYD